MACYRPLRAWQDENDRVVFKGGSPDRRLELPCGKCIGCTSSRASMWMIRCVHESQMHERNCFVTLTYSDKCIPADHSLDLNHWQLFRKRLREAIGPFRFFMAAEYGSKTFRPHYHAIIFGEDFSGDRVLVADHSGRRLWSSALLDEKWRMGGCRIGDVTAESCAYVTKYCVKKQRSMRQRYERVDVDTGECWDVSPEFVTMSRRPGLGSKWFDRYYRDVFPSDEVVVAGRRYRPPRYYDGKLASLDAGSGVDGPALLEELKDARRRSAMEKVQDKTPERLATRERIAESRLSVLGR